ncbi:MAG: chromosome segregation protein [Umezawaea sp.]
MGLADDRDLVPLGSGFDIAKRGYDKGQVEDHLERLDSDLRLLAADRDAAVSQTNDLARQLEAARSEMAEMRGQVDRLSMPPTTLEGLSERLQRMLRLAQEEANEIKSRAEAEGGHIRSKAEGEAGVLRARYEKLIAELDQRRAELEAEHRGVLEKARAEAEKLIEEAKAAAAVVVQEAEQRRLTVEEDFEIAMAARRVESMKILAEQEASSKAEADRRLRESQEEANRIRTQIAQEQAASNAEAQRLVREATEEANRRRHDSISEATARVQEATDESNRRVREATEESNRRVAAATQQVEALTKLRNGLSQQLRGARSALQEIAPLLEPLEVEKVAAAPAPAPVGETVDLAKPAAVAAPNR